MTIKLGWSILDNFICRFNTHNNTAFIAHVIANSTHLISQMHRQPLATSWPVIRNITTRLKMKVQEVGGTEVPIYHKNPFCDQRLISPYSNTAESVIEITRIKEMITNLRNFDC